MQMPRPDVRFETLQQTSTLVRSPSEVENVASGNQSAVVVSVSCVVDGNWSPALGLVSAAKEAGVQA